LNFSAKRFIWSCAFLFTTLTAVSVSHAHAAQPDSVKIQVNDDLVQFPDAQPFIDGGSTLQVPLRLLSEKLGYQVDWSMQGQQVKVTLTNKQQSIGLVTGEDQAVVNGKPESLEGKAVFSQGRAYVPLRFITENFGSKINWNTSNQIAIIEADGKTHNPAWTAPKVIAPVAAPAAAPTPKITDQITQFANAFIGVPYAWGGTSPNGFDCSGFVRYVYSNSGIDLPRTSADMHNEVGTTVFDLKVGDLVFFANRSVDHVGIYVGNNQFISATSSRGVKVDSLSSNYWGARYVGAKRVL
jgi:peptidoglycan endopeptidase LytE